MALSPEEKVSRRYQQQLSRYRGKRLNEVREAVAAELQKAIRMEAADDDGYCQCVTCGTVRKWNDQIHAGHFVSGRGNGVLFDERGIHPQCSYCNDQLKGNQEEYYQYMLANYSQEVIDELLRQRRQGRQYTREELTDQVFEYRDRIRKQEARLGK